MKCKKVFLPSDPLHCSSGLPNEAAMSGQRIGGATRPWRSRATTFIHIVDVPARRVGSLATLDRGQEVERVLLHGWERSPPWGRPSGRSQLEEVTNASSI